MEKTVQAVYENGVLHPLEPLALRERQQVTVTISDKIDASTKHPLLASPDERSYAAHDDVGLEEVSRALSTIDGSLSEAVLEERRERWLPRYFLDTSAVAKLYRTEAGSEVVDRMFSEPGSQQVISRLTIVEIESVFALKMRTGEIDHQAVLIARRGARQLLIKYGATEALRTLDALQLSIALGLKRAGLATVFVGADQKLCRVAALEGFAVANPEQPPSVLIWGRQPFLEAKSEEQRCHRKLA